MPVFLHTADLHINSLRRFSGPSYLQRSERTLAAILDIASEHDVDFIIAAGDIWERCDILHSEREVLSRWLARSPVPIVMVSGNHDTRSSLVGDTVLNYLRELGDNLKRHHVHDGLPEILPWIGCTLLLFPWHSWDNEDMNLLLNVMVKRAAQDSDLPIVVVMHEAVAGNQTDTGMEIRHRNQIHLPDMEEVTYWALGDIHKRQSILPNAWYSGSPQQHKFDESPDKGVLIVDTGDPTNPEFVPIETARLVIMNEVPEKWPDSSEAFVSLRTIPDKPVLIPENVEWGEQIIAPEMLYRNLDRIHGTLDGLENVMARVGLPTNFYELTWEMAVEIANLHGLNETIPKRYRSRRDRQSRDEV